jgi:dolichol kinase
MKSEILLNFDNEIKRKKIHLLSFFIPIYYLLWPNSILLFIALLLISIIAIDIYRLYSNKNINLPFLRLINSTIRLYEKDSPMSATLLVFTSFLIIVFFKSDIAIIAISIASICDTIAAVYGMKYGKIKLLFNKTLEGSFAFLITSLLLVFLLSYFTNSNLDIIYLMICSLLATIAESVTPTKYDNVTVPLVVSISMQIFYLI